MAIKFDVKTGQVFLRNYDQGVIETLGGYIGLMDENGSLVDVTSRSSLTCSKASCRKNYFIDVPLVSPTSVPVIFNQPFPTFEKKFLPSFLIARGDATPAMDRWHSIGATQYRVPSDSASAVQVTLANGQVVSGYSEYESLVQAFPFDIPYTITAMARYEREAIPMLKKILSVYKPCSRILLRDSLCSIRSYTAWNENGYSDVGEILNINDRMKGYSIEIRIEGELDLSDPEITPAALELVQNSNTLS